MSAQRILARGEERLFPHKHSSIDLRSPGLLGRSPMIGLWLFILGMLMFGGLTWNLFAHGPLLAWDTALAKTLPAIALKGPPFTETLMAIGFYLGKQVIMVLDVMLGVYYLYKRYWEELAMVTLGWMGAAMLFYWISTFLARPRPPSQIWIIVNLPGFPSGHAISVVVCYGWLAYILAPKIRPMLGKIFVIALALLLILFVGFSRIFTGGHYLTDILAGYGVGLAWSGFVYTLVEMYYQRKRSFHVQKR
jgi:membrane-associated phospholipid phosphatase